MKTLVVAIMITATALAHQLALLLRSVSCIGDADTMMYGLSSRKRMRFMYSQNAPEWCLDAGKR
jgi:hypothetical protein